MKKVIASSIFITLFLFLNSCKKYDDGPIISFRSAESRLCRKWTLKDATLNGSSVRLGSGTYQTIIEYKTNGTVSLTGDTRLLQGNQNGIWTLTDNNTKLTTDFNGTVKTKEITRLTNADLWFSKVNSLGEYVEKYEKY